MATGKRAASAASKVLSDPKSTTAEKRTERAPTLVRPPVLTLIRRVRLLRLRSAW